MTKKIPEAADLARLLANEAPDSAQIHIESIEEISIGWETEVYALRAAFPGAQDRQRGDYVLRLYAGVDGRMHADRDYALLGRLAALDFPVPRRVALADKGSPFGVPLIVMERIQGPLLADVLAAAPADARRGWLLQAAQLLADLHRLSPAKAVPGHAAPDPESYLANELARMRDLMEKQRLVEFEPHLTALERDAGAIAAVDLVLLHNDYHPANILVREADQSLVVIDWTWTDVGDYRLELAWTGLMLQISLGEVWRDAFWADYAKSSSRSLDNLAFFERLKFTQRMLTIAHWLQPDTVIPVPKITRQAIRGDYRVHVLNVYQRLQQLGSPPLPTIEAL
jgi:aminoglycoside phosphotransferase (APT) family kinase protein